MLYNPFLIPFFERRFQKWTRCLLNKKVGHSQLSLAGTKGELVAGCGGQQAGGDFVGKGFYGAQFHKGVLVVLKNWQLVQIMFHFFYKKTVVKENSISD